MTEETSRLLQDPKRYERLVEAVGDQALHLLDPKGRILTWNAAAERITGHAAREIVGQPFARLFTPEDRRAEAPDALLAQARATREAEDEGWRAARDGRRFWAQTRINAIRGDDGELMGFASTTRDLTGQRAAQADLIESERRFRYLVEGVVDYAIYMLDVNGTVTNWNRGAERIKGYRAEEIIGRHFSTFYTPEDRRAGRPARALERALRDGRFESEGWRVRKDGGRFWASAVIDAIHDDDGRHIGYAKITRDISEARAHARPWPRASASSACWWRG